MPWRSREGCRIVECTGTWNLTTQERVACECTAEVLCVESDGVGACECAAEALCVEFNDAGAWSL